MAIQSDPTSSQAQSWEGSTARSPCPLGAKRQNHAKNGRPAIIASKYLPLPMHGLMKALDGSLARLGV